MAAALASQKSRYEDRLKEVREQLNRQVKEKMTQMRELFVRKAEAQKAKLQAVTEENRSLLERLSSVDQKVEQMEAVNCEEVRVFRYEICQLSSGKVCYLFYRSVAMGPRLFPLYNK